MMLINGTPSNHQPFCRDTRLAWHLVGLVLLKVAVLLLIYAVCFRPFGRPDAGPGAVASRIAPTPQKP
jgi:uncharacterized membrane protein YedE/YeeE